MPLAARVRDRLTPKEMQIVALIVQGCKNKEIALKLNTKEQVIKNYLRSIYDKIGVSDRLELALFTLHHRVLAGSREPGRTLLCNCVPHKATQSSKVVIRSVADGSAVRCCRCLMMPSPCSLLLPVPRHHPERFQGNRRSLRYTAG